MASKLTARQQEILEYLRRSHQRSGIMPSTRELQHHFGFASQTAAVSHLRALEKKGAVLRLPGKARAVVLAENFASREVHEVPLYGNIAAGYAEPSEQQEGERIALDSSCFHLGSRKQVFALKVEGDSMIEAHICPGDTVVLEKKQPKDGDVVAALIDGETTLKRYREEQGKVYLHAENSAYPDLFALEELRVQGVMVGLLRAIA